LWYNVINNGNTLYKEKTMNHTPLTSAHLPPGIPLPAIPLDGPPLDGPNLDGEKLSGAPLTGASLPGIKLESFTRNE
jgi:hypothetical protein